MEKENQLSDFFNGYNRARSSSPEDKTTENKKEFDTFFTSVKWKIGKVITEKFLEHNEGKFHTALELNPAIHAAAEFCEAYGTLCRNKAIEEAVKVATENGNVRIDLVSTLNKLKV